jgi:hypothetical protein
MAEIRIFSNQSWAFVAMTLLFSGAVHAQDAPNPREAARHFDRGYLLAQQGSLEAAIVEFKQAYALSPHPSVLYNLGQAYAASGRAVEAVQTLRKYLDAADPKTDAERRAQAAALMEYQGQRIGTLELEIEPKGAELSLDGDPIGSAPLAGPMQVTAGTHALTVSRLGYVPRTVRVEVVARQAVQQAVRLQPSGTSLRLKVSCGVPDVTAFGDGRVIGQLPRGGELVLNEPPTHLRFERAGFVPKERALPGNADEVIDCGLRELDAGAKLLPVRLDAPPGVLVRIDGHNFRGGRLPPGRHLVAMSGRDLEPSEHWISVSQSQPRIALDAHEATTQMVDERSERRSLQRLSGLVVAGAGIASLAGAGVVYALNQAEYAAWRDDGRALAARMSAEPSAVSPAEWNGLLERENALRNRDAAALGLAVLGGALTLTGAALWLTAPSPAKSGITLQVGERAWVGYSGRF